MTRSRPPERVHERAGDHDPLSSEVATQLLAYVRPIPDTAVAAIARASGVLPATLQYHVKTLTPAGVLTGVRGGNRFHLFKVAAGLSLDERFAVVIERDVMASLALAIIEHDPGITCRELAQQLGMSRTAARFHVMKLLRAGLVQRRRSGRRVRLTVEPSRLAAIRKDARVEVARTSAAALAEDPSKFLARLECTHQHPPLFV